MTSTTLTMTSTTPTTNLTNEEKWSYLVDLDQEETTVRMFAAMIFIGILGVVGLFGNILVIIVYAKYFKHNPSRIFIISVAVFDLISNILCIPGEIFDLKHSFRFQNAALCKYFRFNNVFAAASSISMLVIICIERYLKICRPFKPQIELRVAYKLVGIVASVSFISSLPAIVVYGVKTKKINKYGVEIDAYECNISDDYQGSVWPSIYKAGQFLTFLVFAVILIVLYSLIGLTIYRHNKRRYSLGGSIPRPTVKKQQELTPSSSNDVMDKPDSSPDTESISTVSTIVSSPSEKNSPKVNFNFDTSIESVSDESLSSKKDRKNSTISNKAVSLMTKLTSKILRSSSQSGSRKGSETLKPTQPFTVKYKTTLMLLSITAAFIISYLPHLVISCIKIFVKDFVSGLTDAEFMVYTIFLRSYFLNSAINPIIYCFWNKIFRDNVVQLFCKNRSKSVQKGRQEAKVNNSL
ncbi:cholecystokinin receptor [Patella vulgata]|uniref:cholecystokinin receptor n=1 Tax=Patella vulgata TaxID=6465 RepID=UPI00217FF617|nr:cholecystokinin receptor [Patella vulgata]